MAGGHLGLAMEASCDEVESMESARGADPKVSATVLDQGNDVVVAQKAGFFARTVHDEAVAVVAVQSFLGAEPEEAEAVLDDRHHRVLRKPILHGEPRETRSLLGEGRG